jgi:hypothetical protein
MLSSRFQCSIIEVRLGFATTVLYCTAFSTLSFETEGREHVRGEKS